MLQRNGKVLLTTSPARPSDARLKRAQGVAHSSGAALRIARELIRQKLAGQERVAQYKLQDIEAARAIAANAADLERAETISTVRLIESQAAAEYWSVWHDLPIIFPRNDLPRATGHWRSFGARVSWLTGSPRLAANPANAILNYLYAILETETRLATAALGLDPALGVLHVDTPNRDSLALDILEPVRAQVDSYVLDTFVRQPLRREWFFEERNGNARLMAPFAARLAETARMWARAVAPIAEWVAQALWNSTQRKGSNQSVPTRLTQRRKTEGRGKDFATVGIPTPKRMRICEVCGAGGVHNRYCKSCAVEISRETMVQVALIGHATPKTAKRKAQISKKICHHATAITWWSPASLPKWLTQDFLFEKILPRLRGVKVRLIAETLGVSKAYAALIRTGRRRPHPRHWENLAKLAKVSGPFQDQP